MWDNFHVINFRRPSPVYVKMDLCGYIGASFAYAFDRVSTGLHDLVVPHFVLNINSLKGIDSGGLRQLLAFGTLM